MKTFASLFLWSLLSLGAAAQTEAVWNGKRCAVVLTYDDGLNSHLNTVIPALDSVGLKGTFYVSDYFGGLSAQIPGWRKAAASGHELANHTVWHPCEGGKPGREFVTGDYDLRLYTVRRLVDEIRTMNNLLKAMDGKTARTFAYPCGDAKLHDTAYLDFLRNDFVAARGVRSGLPAIGNVDLYDLPCYVMNGQSGAQMIELVKAAMEKNALLVFLFHGVGGDHSLNVSPEAHRELLRFLSQRRDRIWVAPVMEAAAFIKKTRALKNLNGTPR